MKHRLKQFFKVSIALIAILVMVVAFFSWRSYAEVEAALKPIRDRGEPVSLANLRAAAVAEDENAATYLKPIATDVEQVVNEAYPIAYPDDFSWRHGLAEGQIAKLRQIFDAHPHLSGEIALASHCNRLAWPLDFESTPNQLMEQVMQVSQDVRAIARFQVMRTRYLAAIGKPDDAVGVCLEELRLVRLQADTPLLVSWMVNLACRREVLFQLNGLLQTETLTPETHAEIEHELAQQQLASHFTQTLKSERAFGIESFRGFSILAASLTPQLANYIEYMNEQIETSSRPPNEPASTSKVTAVGMTTLLVPAIDSARDAMKHTLATERCLRVLNAIQSRQEPSIRVVRVLRPTYSPTRNEPVTTAVARDCLNIHAGIVDVANVAWISTARFLIRSATLCSRLSSVNANSTSASESAVSRIRFIPASILRIFDSRVVSS